MWSIRMRHLTSVRRTLYLTPHHRCGRHSTVVYPSIHPCPHRHRRLYTNSTSLELTQALSSKPSSILRSAFINQSYSYLSVCLSMLLELCPPPLSLPTRSVYQLTIIPHPRFSAHLSAKSETQTPKSNERTNCCLKKLLVIICQMVPCSYSRSCLSVLCPVLLCFLLCSTSYVLFLYLFYQFICVTVSI